MRSGDFISPHVVVGGMWGAPPAGYGSPKMDRVAPNFRKLACRELSS